jgi:alcohol dehydrogenase
MALEQESHMKAAVLSQFGEALRIEEIPDPKPGAGDVVVQVLATPVLGYMKDVLSGKRNYPLLLPLAPGSGAIGKVLAVGPDATRLKPGQLVFCDPTVRSRDDSVAPDIMLQGLIAPGEGPQRLQTYFRNGAFAEQMLLPLENATALDGLEEFDPVQLGWMSTFLVPYGGLLAAGLQAGETVLISGATGHFGGAAVAVALAMGAALVIAPGRNEKALDELSQRFGPRVRTVQLSGNELEDRQQMQRAAGIAIDKVLDILPPINNASPVRAAALAVRPYGTVVLMGGVDADLDLPYKEIMRNCITLRGQFMYPRSAPRQLSALIRSGLLSLQDLGTTTFVLNEINTAVEHAAASYAPWQKTIIKF